MIVGDVDASAAPGPGRNRHVSAALLGAALVLLVIVGLVNRARAQHDRLDTTLQAPAPLPVAEPVQIAGHPLAITGQLPLLYALTSNPATVTRLDPSRPVTAVATTAVPADSYQLVLDQQSSQLTLLEHRDAGQTVITELDALSLTTLNSRVIDMRLDALATDGGRLWLGTDSGLYVLDTGQARPRPVAGITEPVYAIAIDPQSTRVFVASSSGSKTTISVVTRSYYYYGDAPRTDTPRVIASTDFAMTHPSLVFTDQEELWLAARNTDNTGRLLRMDPNSLRALVGVPPSVSFDPDVSVQTAAGRLWVINRSVLTCNTGSSGSQLQAFAGYTGDVAGGGNAVLAIGTHGVKLLDLGRTECRLQ